MMRNLNVFVLPSIWEGFPYVLLEAMALKKPIVATDIFGVNEIIDDKSSGILVPPRDSDNIAEAVVTVLSDNIMSRKLGESAYRRVVADFSLKRSIASTTQLYYQLFRDTVRAK